MFLRPSLALFALTGALFGATVAARAGNGPYPLPTAPAAGADRAQGPQATHPRRRLRAALAQLDLSPAQRSQIRSLVQSFRAARNSATPMTRRQLVANIEGVLTPDQRTQFHTLMRHSRQPRNGAPAGTTTATPSPA